MLGADVRCGEWGSPFPAELVRDFIHCALRHPTANDLVSEYVFDIAAGDDEPPADIGKALRVAIGEVLSAASDEDWEQVGRDLLADARACIGDDPPPAASPEDEPSIPAAWWPPLPGRSPRKPMVFVKQEAILTWLIEQRSATTAEIAEHFAISKHTARMKSDGLVAQGKLHVTPGETGRHRRARRYSVPRTIEQPADGPGGELPSAREESSRNRLALPTGSS